MGNLTLFAALSLITGILSGYSGTLNIHTLIASIPICLTTGYFLIKSKNTKIFALFLLSFIIFGYFSAFYFAVNPLDNQYGKEASVSGIIKYINRYDASRDYMSVMVASDIIIEDKGFNENLLVYIKRNEQILPGMSIAGIGRLSEPDQATNFLEFDYKDYLNRQGIKAIFFMEESYELGERINLYHSMQNSFKAYIVTVLDSHLSQESSSLLKGILLGDRSFIDEEILSNIRGLGVAHILAVSGLHIGIIILSLNRILSVFRLRRSIRITASILMAWLYGSLIGFPVSVLRALIMASVLSVGYLSHRRYDPLNSVMVTMMAMLIFRPLWIYDIGFQLSFAAVASILVYLRFVVVYQLNRFAKGLVFLVFIQLFTLPISIYYFNYFPLFNLMANLIFIPIISYILFMATVALGVNLIIPWIAPLLLLPVNAGLMLIIWISEHLMMFPIRGFHLASPSMVEIVLFYMLLGFLIFLALNKNEKYRFKKLYLVMTSTVIIYIAIFLLMPSIFSDQLILSFIDTGQGSSALIQYKNIDFMVDAGGEISGTYQSTDYIFPDYLIKRGIRRLDTIFLSHYHRDHYSGIFTINDSIDVKSFVSSYHQAEILSDLGQIRFYQINSGDTLIIDEDMRIEVLWPPKSFLSTDENQNSLVMQINYRDFSILFTGDIDLSVESNIADALEPVDVVVVPHHGSKSSSGSEFIESIKPTYGIISYGENNYGIPSEDVIRRYEEFGVGLLSTYEHGEIIISVDRDSSFSYVVYKDKSNHNSYLMFVSSLFFVFFSYQVIIFKRSSTVYEL